MPCASRAERSAGVERDRGIPETVMGTHHATGRQVIHEKKIAYRFAIADEVEKATGWSGDPDPVFDRVATGPDLFEAWDGDAVESAQRNGAAGGAIGYERFESPDGACGGRAVAAIAAGVGHARARVVKPPPCQGGICADRRGVGSGRCGAAEHPFSGCP